MRKIINYTGFYNQFAEQQVFSREQAELVFPKFDSRRLFEWKQKKYLIKLTNKWYVFANAPLAETLSYNISNSICQPSYISLESALQFYGILSVDSTSIQAITQHKTVTYVTDRGVFNYRKIKPSLYLGFVTILLENRTVLMAEKEKALVDFLYFNANMNSISSLNTLDWNVPDFANLDWSKVSYWQDIFNSNALNRRVDLLKKLLKIGVI